MPGSLSHIAFIAGNYPSPSIPYGGIFFQRLIQAEAARGLHCTVVHPVPVHQWVRDLARGGYPACPDDPKTMEVVRPVYVSIASRRLGLLASPRVTQAWFQQAALRALRRLGRTPDAVYGHFLYPAGGAAVWLGRRLNRPSFVAVGEGAFWSVAGLGLARAREDFAAATGLLAVSTLLKKMLVADLKLPPEKIAVFPNGVDLNLFHSRSRTEMRKKWNLPDDIFIAAFVGNFNSEKGIERVVAAIEGLEGVGAVLVGTGPVTVASPNVLFQGRVPHAQIPELLSTADAFVLPTTREGCCNAIIEAMACGLPIISSRNEFNDDLLDESMSIRIDPLDIGDIRRAIVQLRDDAGRRQQMAAAALARSRQFDIHRRAERIAVWMSAAVQPPLATHTGVLG